MKTYKVVLFLIINLFIVVLACSSAFAQSVVVPPEAVSSSLQVLLERGGILGAVCILEGVAIFLLFKDLKQQHEKTLEWAVKATDVLATAMVGAQKAEGTLLRAIEQLAKNESVIKQAELVLAAAAAKGSGGSRDQT